MRRAARIGAVLATVVLGSLPAVSAQGEPWDPTFSAPAAAAQPDPTQPDGEPTAPHFDPSLYPGR